MEEFGLRMHTEAAQGSYCVRRSERRLIFSGPNSVRTEPKATPFVDVRAGSPKSRRCLGSGAGGESQDLLQVCTAPPGWAGAVPPRASWHGSKGLWCRSTAPAGLRGSELCSRSSANSGGQHFASWKPRERSVFPKSCSSEATCNGELRKLGVPPATSSAKTKPWQMVVVLRSAPARVWSGSWVHEPQFSFFPLEVRAV